MQERTDWPPGENLFAPIRWTVWDTPLRIAIHPNIADDSTEFPRLVLVCMHNGWMRITSTRRPLAAVSTAIRVAREHDTSVVSALISAPRPRMGAVCGSLFKRLQLEGYRYRGHGFFEALDVPQALGVLAQTIRVEPPPAPPTAPKIDATATTSPSTEHEEPQMSDNTLIPQAPTEGLIPVFVGCIGGIEQHVCNACDLHAFLEVGKDFTTWIKERIEKYQFVENQDFKYFSPDLGKNPRGRGRPSSEFHLTLDMGMARRYFIECERKALNMAAGVVKARTKERLVALTQGMVKKGHGATSVSSWVVNWQPPGYSTWNQVSWH